MKDFANFITHAFDNNILYTYNYKIITIPVFCCELLKKPPSQVARKGVYHGIAKLGQPVIAGAFWKKMEWVLQHGTL